MEHTTDKLSKTWAMLANMLPPLGLYLYFRHRRHQPQKAKTALTNALIGIPVAVLMGYVMQNFVLA
jgi:hypothetical protein